MRMARAHRRDERSRPRCTTACSRRASSFAFELRVTLERAVPVEVIGRDVQHGRRERARGCRVVSIWKLEISSTYSVGVGSSSRSSAGGPRLPPAGSDEPCALSISRGERRDRALAVLPVTAMTRRCARARANSSMSPITAKPRGALRATSGMSTASPGDSTTRLTPSSQRAIERRRHDLSARARSCSSREPRRRCAAVDHAHGSPRARDSARRIPGGAEPTIRLVLLQSPAPVPARQPCRCAAASSSIAALPRFAASSADLQARQADQHQDHGDDPETHDHLRLGPTLELEVVMDRRHAKNAPAGHLVGGNLDDD